MFIFIVTIHVLVSILLVTLVLLQNPKGGNIGFLGGQSGSKSVFSSTGASDFLLKATKWCAAIFALTSIQLAYMSSRRGDESIILDNQNQIESSESLAPSVPTDSEKP